MSWRLLIFTIIVFAGVATALGLQAGDYLIGRVPVQANITVNRILSREFLLLDDQYGFTDGLNRAVVANRATPVGVTDADVQNNYDVNNELAYYDPAVDWDELTAVIRYDGQEYDSQNYGETVETEQSAYTEEGPAIVVTKN